MTALERGENYIYAILSVSMYYQDLYKSRGETDITLNDSVEGVFKEIGELVEEGWKSTYKA